jgi:hypothetical protein
MIIMDPTRPKASGPGVILANPTGPGTGSDSDDGDDDEQEHLDELLDEALDETFPASDPVALTPKKTEADDEPGRDDDLE